MRDTVLLIMYLVPLFSIVIDCSVPWKTLHSHGFTVKAPSFYMRKRIIHLCPNLRSQDKIFRHLGQIKAFKASCIAGACKMFIGQSDLWITNLTSPNQILQARTFGPVVNVEDCGTNSVLLNDTKVDNINCDLYYAEIAHLDFVAAGGIIFHKHILLRYTMYRRPHY